MGRNSVFAACVIVIVCVMMVPLSLAFAQPAGETKPITLKFNWEIASGKSMSVVWPFRPGGRFHQILDGHTGGKLKLDIKEGLVGPTESILAVGDGRVDIGTQITAFCSGTYPLLDWGGLPGFITSGPAVGYEWTEAMLDPRMVELLERYTRPKGFVIVGALPSLSSNSIWGKKPIRTLEDFKGQKIRGAGVFATKELEAFGAKAVSISVAEVEEALIRGTVDAVHTSLNYGCEHRFFDIVNYVSIWPFTQPYPIVLAINTKAYDALPRDLQEGLRAAGAQMSREISSVCEQMEITYRLWAESSKAKVVYAEPSDVAKAADRLVPVIEMWLKVAGQEGPELLRIASEYATGPTLIHVKELVRRQ
jgi:TRAP-type transport system periplasmic protein